MPGTHTWPREVWVLPARWNVAVETDNSPLEQIFKKNINEAPSWLQRLLLRRLRFDVNVQYKQGRSIPVADALSRVCHGIAAPTTKSMTEDYVSQRNIHFISTRIDLKAVKSSMVLTFISMTQLVVMSEDFRRPVAFIERKGFILPVS